MCPYKSSERRREYYRQWREARPDYWRKWHEARPGGKSAYNRRWNEANKAVKAQCSRKWREAHKEEIAEYNQQYYLEHSDEIRELKRKWRHENPGKAREIGRRRRAHKHNAYVEDIDETFICERDRYACVYCGSPFSLSLDHVVPLANSGTHSYDNLVVACRGCNSSKGTQEVFQWLASSKYRNGRTTNGNRISI